MEQRKRLSAKEKMIVLRELLENKVQIGELSEKYNIHPNVIYNWKKTLFEKGKTLFEPTYRTGRDKREKINSKTEEKIARLESKLTDRNDLISEILGDNIRLKKSLSGDE